LMRSPHTQTVMGSLLRSKNGIDFRRERVDTPDGDFLDIDFADVKGATWDQLGDTKPIVLFLHGLEGNARSGPAQEIYRYLARRGVRCVGMNMRSCSGELNRTPTMYHAGKTDDLGFIHDWLSERYSDVPIGIVAISLGANILLKYLGEQGECLTDRLAAAVAISPPFDLLAGAAVMASGAGALYTRRMLDPLKAKVKGHADLLDGLVDLEPLDSTNDFYTFDDLYTAPLHGFEDAKDYYVTSSSQNFIDDIRVPTLILRSVDDPFFDPNDIPYKRVEDNPFLFGGFPLHGGHVGFIEGALPGRYTYWAERQAARFLAVMI
jgi:predicted alpha/beta-fold hydrolase